MRPIKLMALLLKPYSESRCLWMSFAYFNYVFHGFLSNRNFVSSQTPSRLNLIQKRLKCPYLLLYAPFIVDYRKLSDLTAQEIRWYEATMKGNQKGGFMDPVGKYFRTRYELIYCYTSFGLSFECICVGSGYIRTMYFRCPEDFPRSTRKAFMKAYNQTVGKLDEIVTIV